MFLTADIARDCATADRAAVVADKSADIVCIVPRDVDVEERDIFNRAGVVGEQALRISGAIDFHVADCVFGVVAVEGARESRRDLTADGLPVIDDAQVDVLRDNEKFAVVGVAAVHVVCELLQVFDACNLVGIISRAVSAAKRAIEPLQVELKIFRNKNFIPHDRNLLCPCRDFPVRVVVNNFSVTDHLQRNHLFFNTLFVLIFNQFILPRTFILRAITFWKN